MADGRVRFGQIDFDAARGRMTVAGRPVSLDRPCMAILAALLREPGKDIDKDQLLEAGWPGRVVHENSLAKAIGRLRQALGEAGAALETAHGYGYRLAVDPEEVEGAPRRNPCRWRRTALVAAGLGLVIAAALSLTPFQGREERQLVRGEPADALGRVLWVDDNPGNNAEEKAALERRGIAVYQVATSAEALPLLAMYEYRAVISDMNRHGEPLAGIELVREMRRRNDHTPFILYTFVESDAQRRLIGEAGGQGATTTSEELYAAILPLFAKSQPAKRE